MPLISAEKRYEYICQQIDREDQLYQTRFNFFIVINIAILTAAGYQLDSESDQGTRLFIFICCILIALILNFTLIEIISSGSSQITYLKSLYGKDDITEDNGFPKPFFFGLHRSEKFIMRLFQNKHALNDDGKTIKMRRWIRVPALSVILWIAFSIFGLSKII